MDKFKVGEAKTDAGFLVTIFEVSDKIYGTMLAYDIKRAMEWDLKGMSLDISGVVRDFNLLSNAEPETVEFKTRVGTLDLVHLGKGVRHAAIIDGVLAPFIDKRVRVWVTVIE